MPLLHAMVRTPERNHELKSDLKGVYCTVEIATSDDNRSKPGFTVCTCTDQTVSCHTLGRRRATNRVAVGSSLG